MMLGYVKNFLDSLLGYMLHNNFNDEEKGECFETKLELPPRAG